MATRFSVNGSVANARLCSGSVGIVIADSDTAALFVAPTPGAGKSTVLTAVTSRAWKDVWTTATGNVGIGDGKREHS
jgi:hypothetical protein